MPQVIQVIQSQVLRGKGTDESPVRLVTQYHTLDGEFLSERDPSAYAVYEWLRQHGDHGPMDPLMVSAHALRPLLEAERVF